MSMMESYLFGKVPVSELERLVSQNGAIDKKLSLMEYLYVHIGPVVKEKNERLFLCIVNPEQIDSATMVPYYLGEPFWEESRMMSESTQRYPSNLIGYQNHWMKVSIELIIEFLKTGSTSDIEVGITFPEGIAIILQQPGRNCLTRCVRTVKISNDKALWENPHDAKLWKDLGRNLTRISEFKFAFHAYDKALEIDPSNPRTRKLKEETLSLLEKKYNEAIDEYDKKLKGDPASPKIWRDKGRTFQLLRMYDGAVKAYDRALQINPNLPELWEGKGSALYCWKKYEGAVEAYDNARKINPEYPWNWQMKGNALRCLGRVKEANVCFTRAETLRSERRWKKENRLKKIDMFIDKIIKGCDDDRSRLIAVLEARGFLIDKKGEDFFLSDNSHRDDGDYLNKLLNEATIGCINNNRIEIKKIPPLSQFYEIFFSRRGESYYEYHSEESYYDYPGEKYSRDYPNEIPRYKAKIPTWNYFQYRKFGRKIPVRVLDPCIARLIKSISAAGVLTDMSCDGCKLSHPRYRLSPPENWPHHIPSSNNPWVLFSSNINALYFRFLFNTLVKPKVALKCQWDFYIPTRTNADEYRGWPLLIISSTDNTLVDVFRELQDVAHILYKNRIFLQNMKQYVVGKINKDKYFWQNRKRKTFNKEMNEDDQLELCRLFDDNIRQYCLNNTQSGTLHPLVENEF